MTKTLAFIHTSPVLVPSFNVLAKQHLNGVRSFHLVDESLIQETIRAGHLEKRTIRRLARHIESACDAGASAVLVTCSSIGPAVPAARPLFDIPLLRIDERMAQQAVSLGKRIGVIATLMTTLEPTVDIIKQMASQLGQSVEVNSCLCKGAFEAVVNGDTETHDTSVREHLIQLSGSVDVIVLAQASMARVVEKISPQEARVPVLSSPPLAMAQAKEVLESLEGQ